MDTYDLWSNPVDRPDQTTKRSLDFHKSSTLGHLDQTIHQTVLIHVFEQLLSLEKNQTIR